MTTTRRCFAHFDLGMDDWGEDKKNDNPEAQPSRKSCGLGSRKEKQSDIRYNFLDKEEKDHSKLAAQFVPENTANSIKWTFTNFTDWIHSRKEQFTANTNACVPEDIMTHTNCSGCANG